MYRLADGLGLSVAEAVALQVINASSRSVPVVLIATAQRGWGAAGRGAGREL
jgi:hypothetical protein